jgi:hypothetical protein
MSERTMASENREIDNTSFSGIQQFRFSFEELAVIPSDLGIMLGFHAGNAPEPFPDMIASALQEAADLFDIKAGYRRITPVVFRKEMKQVEAGGFHFSPGKIIYSQIRKSVEAAFFVATAGQRVSERCRLLNKTGDTIYSYVLDVLGSVVAEKAVEKMIVHIEEEAHSTGWHVSEPYSPGYCDWDVAEQQKLFSFFPPGFCGITLSPSSLMSPLKSISGIIGIGAELNRKGYQCKLCTDRNCIYGRIRRK